MSNPSTVAGFVGSGTGRNLFPTQTVAATTETILKIGTDAGSANLFFVVPTGGQIYGASSPLDASANQSITSRSGRAYGVPSGVSNDQFSTETWNAHPFFLRMSGIGNAGANAAQSLIFNLYQGTSATLASDKAIATTGAALATVAGGAFAFEIEARLLWDPTSQILSGSYTSNIAFGTVSQFTTTTVITNVVTAVTAAKLSFLGTVILGNAASSTVTLKEFSVSQI
jgi:hypothetical protein